MTNRPRCLECTWCSPDAYLAPVCAIYDRPLSKRDMWRPACAAFEEIDVAAALEQPEGASSISAA